MSEQGLSMTCYLSGEEVEAITQYLEAQDIPVTPDAIRKQARKQFHEKQQAIKEQVKQQEQAFLNPMPHTIQLENIFIRSMHMERSPHSSNNWHTKINMESVSFEGDAGALLVSTVSGQYPDEISIIFCAIFRSHGNHSESEFTQFLQNNSLSLLLPFIRETLYNMSMRLGLPHPILLSVAKIGSMEDTNKT